jgi:hypothetical protein
MTAVTIDRLTLKLSGLTTEQGRHLSMLIGNGLAGANIGASGEAAQIKVAAAAPREGETLKLLADRLVADILRELERTL